MKNTLYSLISIVLLGILTACGGGGGGGVKTQSTVPSASISITLDNYIGVAKVGYGVFSSADNPTGVQLLNNNPAPATLANTIQQMWSRHGDKTSIQASLTVTGVVYSAPCTYGGSASIDSNGVDTITVSYNNCNEFGTETLNGSITVYVSGPVYSGNDEIFTGYMSFNNLSITRNGVLVQSLNGTLNVHDATNMSTGVNTVTFTTDLLTVRYGAEIAELTNFTQTVVVACSICNVSSDLSYIVNSTELSGSISVSTPESFVFVNTDSLYPYQGKMTIQGLNSSVSITVLGGSGLPTDSISIEVDIENDGIIDASTTMTWAEFVN